MRRCLIAIFALHFFLSVSAFALGGAHSAAALQAPVLSALQSAPGDAESAPQGKALGEAAVNHALVDQVPDLPDSLPKTVLVQRPPVDGGSSIGYRQRAAVPPSLDGLLRPPQQASHPA
ncbi:hypothetical protein [Hydrogenophaga sp.]|uniref:hypothetical protein n=1 Tax=Hydrogenophaga sp. TaxID=1904254 RepID=UPI00261A426E|nr:hypothetical protein [Hydrogenophaga sp.]